MNRHAAGTLLLCALFLAGGSLWLDLQGIQADEALFANGVYEPEFSAYAPSIAGKPRTLMLMPYVGAVKSWLYKPLFSVWAPSAASVRIPMLLAGAATVWLFFLLLRGMAGASAGLLGATLLATDATFLWTTRCDWGPVALQHLLLTAAVYLLWLFSQKRSAATLGVACFLLGLALWDKATAVWPIAGLAAAAAAVYRPGLVSLLSRRRAAVASLAFCLGSLPLWAYNFSSGGETWAQTGRLALAGVPRKLPALWRNLQGEALYGFLMRDPPVERPTSPLGWAQNGSVGLTLALGEPRAQWHGWLLLFSLALVPAFGRTRTAAFFALASAVTWLLMAATDGGGESAHHLVLLWPWPYAFAAVVLARVISCGNRLARLAVPLVVILVAARGLAVTNHHYAQLIRYGAAPPWSEAVYSVAAYMDSRNISKIAVADWGLREPLLLLSSGRIQMIRTWELLLSSRNETSDFFEASGSLFLVHTPQFEAFPGITQRLRENARRFGGKLETVHEFRDRQQIPVMRLLKFQPGSERDSQAQAEEALVIPLAARVLNVADQPTYWY